MKTITAAEANRKFSHVLREVGKGEKFLVLSRGKPVAAVTAFDSKKSHQDAMKKALLSRLQNQEMTGSRNWIRNDLYCFRITSRATV